MVTFLRVVGGVLRVTPAECRLGRGGVCTGVLGGVVVEEDLCTGGPLGEAANGLALRGRAEPPEDKAHNAIMITISNEYTMQSSHG